MKKTMVILFLLFQGFLQGQVVFHHGDLDRIARGERDAWKIRHRPAKPESASVYDVKWYGCHWDIDPAVQAISGNVTMLFVPAGQGLDSLSMDLNQVLTVDSVRYHNVAVSWHHDAGLVTVHFPVLLPATAADSVTVWYHGSPPQNGWGSFVQNFHNGSPIVWTLSEPYGASDWWPCKNGLTDKADSIDIYIRAPHGNRAAANGILVSETPEGNNVIHHWKHRYPIATYLVGIAVTNYAKYTHLVPYAGDTLKVVNYIYPEDSAAAYAQTAEVVPAIQVYDTLFGTYPFQAEKYGHAEFGWGGGMEHQTMTFVTAFGFELITHELGHQWFGDKVTCGSWTDIWLNEGFATYLSGLCYEHLAPIWWTRFRMVRVQSVTSKPGGSVFCTDTTDINRIFDSRLSYAKGALILHQLRWIMGDSAFFAALRNYLGDAALSYGFARTADLKAHLEASYGHDLTWFFNDWFTGEGYPSYHLGWSQTGSLVTLTVGQTQSHPSVSFFAMPIPVKFKNAAHDTLIRFDNTFAGQTFTVHLPFTVDSVLFDPDYQLITANNTIGAIAEHGWLNRLQLFPNPASSVLTITADPTVANLRYELYNSAGQRAGSGSLSGHRTQISITGLADGTYTIVFRNGSQLGARTFVKHR